MISAYCGTLMVGIEPPLSRKVRGVSIFTEANATDLKLGERVGGEFRLTLARGFFGVIESLRLGGGMGGVERRACNVISKTARDRDAVTAIMHVASSSVKGEIPLYSLNFSLYK